MFEFGRDCTRMHHTSCFACCALACGIVCEHYMQAPLMLSTSLSKSLLNYCAKCTPAVTWIHRDLQIMALKWCPLVEVQQHWRRLASLCSGWSSSQAFLRCWTVCAKLRCAYSRVCTSHGSAINNAAALLLPWTCCTVLLPKFTADIAICQAYHMSNGK